MNPTNDVSADSSGWSADDEIDPRLSRFPFLVKSGCGLFLAAAVCFGLWIVLDGEPNSEPNSELNSEPNSETEFDPVFTNGPETRPVAVKSDGYIGSDACQECHPHEHEMWHDSFHRTMTQVASAQSVVGHFDVELELLGRRYRLGREKDTFWVEFEQEGDGETLRRNVVLCTGSHHMQVYWLSTGRGRELAIVPFVWLIPEQRWIPRHMAFLQPPVDESNMPIEIDEWLFERARWNGTCTICHTTHPQPHVDVDPMMSRVAEFGIACEACHGPAESHVRLHKGDNNSHTSDPIVHPPSLTHQRSSEVCGQCHSVQVFEEGDKNFLAKIGSGPLYRPGDNLSEIWQFLQDGSDDTHFWSDGMVRVTGREFSGLSGSACYLDVKMSCLSCHNMHQGKDDPRPRQDWADDQLKPLMRGNEGCLQCHTKYRSAGSLTAHTRHPPSSPGSVCYNCHMPNTNYGLLKATRSHLINSPSAEETLSTGRPNACNLCHLDKSLKWTADSLKEWFDQPAPQLRGEFARNVSLAVDMALRGDAGQRAMIAWHMGWEPARKASSEAWLPAYLSILMDDDYDAIRFIAHRSLKQIGRYDDIDFDFVAPAAERAEPCRQVIDRWLEQMKSKPIHNPSVLVTHDGLELEMVEQLLQERNHRAVVLVE